MFSSNGFQIMPVKDDLPYKVTALDYYDRVLVAGDEQGQLYRYSVNLNNNPDQLIEKAQKDEPFRPNPNIKKPIDKLRFFEVGPGRAMTLILQDGTLYLLSGTQQLKQKIDANKVTMFTLNESDNEKYQPRLLVISKKREPQIFKFEREQFVKDEALAEMPADVLAAAFLDHYVYLALHKKDYVVINLQSPKKEVAKLGPQMPANPWILTTPEKEVVILVPPGLLVFMKQDGTTSEKNTLALQDNEGEPVIIGSRLIQHTLIIQMEMTINFFNLKEQRALPSHRLTNKQKARVLTTSDSRIFLSTHEREIYTLSQIPYDQMIDKCLIAGRTDEAHKLFHNNVNQNDPDYKAKYESFCMRIAWAYIRIMKFDQAKQSFQQLNFDPRELILLYTEFSIVNDIILKGAPQFPLPRETMVMMIDQQLYKEAPVDKNSQTQQQQEANARREKAREASLRFLIGLLQWKREQLIHVDDLNEIVKFAKSEHSVTVREKALPPISAQDLLKAIDCVLILGNVRLGLVPDLKKFLSQGDDSSRQGIFCKDRYTELYSEVSKMPQVKQQDSSVLAIFNECFDRPKEALEIWQTIGTTNAGQPNSALFKEASSKTLKILRKICETNDQKSKDMVKTYLKWVLRYDEASGSDFFKYLSETFISPEVIKTYIEKEVFGPEARTELGHDVQEKARKQWEKYLSAIVLERKSDDQKLHTNLAECYIDELFRKNPPKTSAREVNWADPVIKDYEKKLIDYLKSDSAKCVTQTLLDRVRDTWLIRIEILLYQRDKHHEQAITKLLLNNNIEWAEDYCLEVKEQLITRLFKIIATNYRQVEDEANRCADPDRRAKIKEQSKRYKQYMMGILKKHATNPELDPLQVIDVMPGDWLLDSADDNALYTFLSSVISHTLHKKRSVNSCVNLNKMDMVNAEYNLVKAKEAYKIITKETKCVLCKKPVGEGIAFVVYPNGVVAHHKCIPNNKKLNICPQTHEDFEKTFKG